MNPEKRGEILVKYEVYADQAFAMCFLYDLFVLTAINRKVYHVASLKRRIGFSLLGAGMTVGSLWIPVPYPVKLFLGLPGIMWFLVWFTFPIKELVGVANLSKFYLLYTVFFGSGLLALKRLFMLFGVAVTGTILLGLLGGIWVYGRQKGPGERARAFLCFGEQKVWYDAILDTGNTLIEPFTNRPVQVLITSNSQVKEALLRGNGYVVPYQAVGTKKGILMAYEVPELHVISQGLEYVQRKVLVALSQKGETGELILLQEFK